MIDVSQIMMNLIYRIFNFSDQEQKSRNADKQEAENKPLPPLHAGDAPDSARLGKHGEPRAAGAVRPPVANSVLGGGGEIQDDEERIQNC